MIVKYRDSEFPPATGDFSTERANLYCGRSSMVGNGSPNGALCGGAGGGGRRCGSGGLSRIVLRLRVLVRGEFAFRFGLQIVRGRRGLAFLLFSRMGRGRRRVGLGRSPRGWRGRGLRRRFGLGLLVGRFAIDLLFGRGRGRVIGGLFVQRLRRRGLRFLLGRLRLGRRRRGVLGHHLDRDLLHGGRNWVRPEPVVEEKRERNQDVQHRRRNERDHVEPALRARRRLGQIEALDRLGGKVGLGQ